MLTSTPRLAGAATVVALFALGASPLSVAAALAPAVRVGRADSTPRPARPPPSPRTTRRRSSLGSWRPTARPSSAPRPRRGPS
jgi:hypothetical protein